MKSRVACVVAFATMSIVQTSQAEILNVSFSAVVTSAEANIGLPLPGATIQGSILFNTETEADPMPLPAFLCGPCAGYSYLSAPYQFAADLGTSSFVKTDFGVGVYDNSTLFGPASDTVEFVTRLYSESAHDFFHYSLALTGAATAFSGAALPSHSALQSFWEYGAFTVYNNQSKAILSSQMTEFSVSAVPESSTAMLFVIALSALIVQRRVPRKGLSLKP
jgi:hypothetical protein